MNLQVMFQDKNIQHKGFTLIEILVVLGIIALIAALGTIANTKQYTRQISSSEVSVLISALQKARSSSMNNVDAKPHGVYFGEDPCPNSDYDYCYVIFTGENFGDNPSSYDFLEKNPAVTLGSTFTDYEVVFNQLSGNPTETGNITLTSIGEQTTITVNQIGLIN